MSSIRLKTKQDIKDFFKILAEESVKDAEKKLLDVGSRKIRRQSELDAEAFGKIREEEEEEAAFDDLDVGGFADLPDDTAAVEDEEVVGVEAEQSPASLESDIEDVSLDSIAKKIDLMRSGKSVRDSATEERMRTYFDLLSEPERKALYAFISAVASMMTGEASGEDAADPSEPPYNVTMSSGGSEVEDNVEDEAAVDDTVAVDTDVEVEEEVEEEDSETPISVGGVQSKESISEIRQKVLSLLRRS